jgi:aryl-alcohol dehydrogenase-like predicted oxidoreductase
LKRISRRHFLKTGVAAGALAGVGTVPLLAERGKATDWVTLGNSGVKVTRLAFGTGTNNGRIQRELGQDGFTSLVRHAYDQGIRFFECSDSYPGMHQMLGLALKGIPRENYRLMTKVTTEDGQNPAQKIDDLRKVAQTDYFDIMLLHRQRGANWLDQTKEWQDEILEAEHKQTVRTHGASVHGLPALRALPGSNWLQIGMIRMNHKGTVMDSDGRDFVDTGNVPEIVQHVQAARKTGKGVISMKLVGAGAFSNSRDDRKAAMRFAFRNAGVDCVTVGTKNPGEVDEAIENINFAFA